MRKDIQDQIDKLIKSLPSGKNILGEVTTHELDGYIIYRKNDDEGLFVSHRVFFVNTISKRISKPSFEVIYKTKWELHPDSLKELEEIQ